MKKEVNIEEHYRLDNFNLFEDMLEGAMSYKNYKLLAVIGTFEKNNRVRKNWDAPDNTKAMLLLYNEDTESLINKHVKFNTKGFYIPTKDQGRIYMEQFQ